MPYPRHPKGCPNYGKRASCPPAAPLVHEAFEIDRPLWLVAVMYDLGGHRARMRNKHPDWTEAQVNCCLYWQGVARKQLRDECSLFRFEHRGFWVTDCPEAMGVQVIRTARRAGIPVEPRPTDKVWKIALLGYPTAATRALWLPLPPAPQLALALPDYLANK